MTAKHAENVISVPISEIGNNNKSSLEDFSSFEKKYIKYIPYIPWPTPCEVAVEMKTMVKCEHLAAALPKILQSGTKLSLFKTMGE